MVGSQVFLVISSKIIPPYRITNSSQRSTLDEGQRCEKTNVPWIQNLIEQFKDKNLVHVSRTLALLYQNDI